MSIYQSSTAFSFDADGAYIEKDPQSSKPYTIDWYAFLRGNDLYWSPNVDVHVNQKYTPSAAKLNGHRYKVQSGGTAGNHEPLWPIGSGATVVDGTIVWQEIGVEDSIALSVWTLDAGITQVSSGNDGVNAQVTISGGAAGTTYGVDNRITTVNGVVESKRFRLVVKDL